MICGLNCSHVVDPGNGEITLNGDYEGRGFRIQIIDGLWNQLEGDLSRREVEAIIETVSNRIFR